MDPNQPYNLPTPQTNLTESDVRRIFSDMFGNFNEAATMGGAFFQSANFVTGVSGWQLRSDGAEINGALSVTTLHIPDQTTANSFHVDSSGNTWWGANVATGYTGANAYILSTGEAVFKNIQIGGTTIQYVITNSGIFSFGDGSDGDATCDGSTAVTGMSLAGSTYTMTRDVYFDSLTLDAGKTIDPAGYRIFVKDTLTVNGTIDGNGGNGVAGENGINGNGSTAGMGGPSTSMADGYLKGCAATGGGGVPGAGSVGGGASGSTGANGTAVTNALGSAGTNGGAGGNGGFTDATHGLGAAGGTGGTRTLSNVKLIANWHLATLLDVSSSGSTVKFTNSGTAAGGGGGGGGSVSGGTAGFSGSGGAGGSGGCHGRITAVYARTIIVGAAGVIRANGGTGGAGGSGAQCTSDIGVTSWAGGGGGGGAGGNGGVLILVYNALTNGGSIVADAGSGGAGGAGGIAVGGGGGSVTAGVAGSNGDAGAAGVIYQFQLSL